MKAKAIMVLGTTSGAGKSWLTTALCRWYARQGLRVAPFKAQNMSNNARVVPGLDGLPGEIGSAQYFQALAAGVTPDVRMNPILLKPENDTASQVIVMGRVRDDLKAVPWRQRSDVLWPYARQALHELMADHDLVLIEGAGSPAEINLHSSDYVNMRTALQAHANCLLVSDIDRGGAFAHLYGTFELLPPMEQARIKGFVLNRFRGDASLLSPGPEMLQRLTGVPTLGVIPMWREHGLPEEDGVFDDRMTGPADGGNADTLRVAVVAYPRISNLDEFQPLRASGRVRLSWARQPRDLVGVDWVILPGSKHTSGDLLWMREQGLDQAIQEHARQGRPVLGICGGLQMLGEWLTDPQGIEGEKHAAPWGSQGQPGLGLLPLQTHFERHKLLQATRARFAPCGGESGPWSCLADVPVHGYEIHHGRTETMAQPASAAAMPLREVLHDDQGHCLGWQQGPVLGLYLHGLFECDAALKALLGTQVPGLTEVFEGLAQHVDAHFNPGALMSLLNPD